VIYTPVNCYMNYRQVSHLHYIFQIFQFCQTECSLDNVSDSLINYNRNITKCSCLELYSLASITLYEELHNSKKKKIQYISLAFLFLLMVFVMFCLIWETDFQARRMKTRKS